jgi:lysozyme
MREGLATGIDVSKWQGEIGWNLVAKDHSFAFARLSDGVTKDPYFNKNWEGMKNSEMVRGTYQYFRPGIDALEQAHFLVDEIGPCFEVGDLPPVLDIECKPDWCCVEDLSVMAKTWAEEVERVLLVKPIIYTYPYFWMQFKGGCADWSSKCGLWVAHYEVAKPVVPEQWGHVGNDGFQVGPGWKFWQHSGSGRTAGVAGKVDLNVFNGDKKQLNDYITAVWEAYL